MDVDTACGVAFVKPRDFPALSHFPSLLKSLKYISDQNPGTQIPFPQFLFLEFL